MINKQVEDPAAAVASIEDGAVIMVGGFGDSGSPTELLHALADHGAKDLTVISNNAGSGQLGLAALLATRRVSKVICSFPRTSDPVVFEELYRAGELALEVVPQGTLAERIRAAGVGVGGFYTRTPVGTQLAEGKETKIIDGEAVLPGRILHRR